jgi:hypothetical protein
MMKPIMTGLLMALASLSVFAQGNLSVQLGDLRKSGMEGDVVVLTAREAQVRLSAYGPIIPGVSGRDRRTSLILPTLLSESGGVSCLRSIPIRELTAIGTT